MRLTTDRTSASLDDHERGPVAVVWLLAALVAALLSIFQLDRVTGDAPVQHLYYLPILLAAARLGLPSGLLVGTIAIVLYHFARPAPFAAPLGEADIIQMALFIAVAVVTARLADDARRLRKLATTDDLTGLHNLFSFESRLMRFVRACRLARRPLAMFVLDVDRLKSLNDRYGHIVGAGAVRSVGHVLATTLPAHAVACRFGGDEFVVAIADCTAVQAEAIGNDVLLAVNALAPTLAGQPFPAGTLSVSVGVACVSFSGAGPDTPNDVQTGEALFRAADSRLYAAKERRGGCVSVINLSMPDIAAVASPSTGSRVSPSIPAETSRLP